MEVVLVVVLLDNPRDNTRDKAISTALPCMGNPGGMPMAFVRCYTGNDGQSHFEDLDLLPPDVERWAQLRVGGGVELYLKQRFKRAVDPGQSEM